MEASDPQVMEDILAAIAEATDGAIDLEGQTVTVRDVLTHFGMNDRQIDDLMPLIMQNYEMEMELRRGRRSKDGK